MNKAIIMGRLTKDPDVRYTTGNTPTAVARFTVAVDRKRSQSGEKKEADFISCVSFGKQAEFCEKYLNQGTKVTLSGHIQTGSYQNKDGQKVYTTDVIVEEIEFAESKTADKPADKPAENKPEPSNSYNEGFMSVEDEGLPFN